MGGDKSLVVLIMLFLVTGLEIREVNGNKMVDRKMLIRKADHVHAHHGARFHAYAHAHANSHVQGDMGGGDSMKTVNELCATTTYKDACIKSLGSLRREVENSNDPQQYFKSGVNMTLDEMKKASDLLNTLLPKANTKRVASALKTCKDLLEQSIDRLKMAFDQVMGDGSTLKDPSAIFNIRLELSDVNTFSSSCLDEFVEAQDPQLQHLIQDGISNAKELAVNMLDVVSTYQF